MNTFISGAITKKQFNILAMHCTRNNIDFSKTESKRLITHYTTYSEMMNLYALSESIEDSASLIVA
jgi:hypothetical protein